MTPDQLKALFYGTPQAYQQYLNIISLQKDNPTSQITQRDYLLYNDYDHSKETKTLLKLLNLHKTQQLNLLDHLHTLNNLSLSSSTLEIHFNLFRNICLSFAPPKQIPFVQDLLDRLQILGSVLLHEFNLEACIVEDNIHTTATFDPEKNLIYINTAPNRPKICRYYTPYSTHVLIFARIKNNNNNRLSSPHPFLVRLRDPKTQEYVKGIREKRLDSILGEYSGEEYIFEFENVAISPKELMLDKYLEFTNNRMIIHGDDETFEYQLKLNLLKQKVLDVRKSVSDALHAAFLAVKFLETANQTVSQAGYKRVKMTESIVEILTLHLATLELSRFASQYWNQKHNNFHVLSDLFIFYDAYEVFVSEKCFANISQLQETVDTFGRLLDSGIPALQKRSLNNLVYVNDFKDLNYFKLADFLVQSDIERKGEFLHNYVYLLTERKENNVYSNVAGFENNLEILDWIFGKRVVQLRSEVKTREVFQVSEDYRKLLKRMNDMSEINSLCTTFLTYLTQAAVQRYLEERHQGANKNSIYSILVSYVQQNLLGDIGYIIQEQGKILAPDAFKILKKSLLNNYINLTPQIALIMNSLHFQEAGRKSDFKKIARIPKEKSKKGQQALEEARREICQSLNENLSPKM